MSTPLVVHKGRTAIVQVSLGIDVSADTIESQIRAEPDQSSAFIAEWIVSYPSGGDGSDGELVFTLDDTFTSQITANSGYMDIKRVSGGEPYAVNDKPIRVIFQGTVTE